MFLSLIKTAFCLTDILLTAGVAGKTINYIMGGTECFRSAEETFFVFGGSDFS